MKTRRQIKATKKIKTIDTSEEERKWSKPYKATKAEKDAYFSNDSADCNKAELLREIKELCDQAHETEMEGDIMDVLSHEIDDYVPAPGKLDELLAKWHEIPEERRRRILNGWPGDFTGELAPVSGQDLIDLHGGDAGVSLVMAAMDDEVIGAIDFGFRNLKVPELTIPLGANKETVLVALADFRQAIESDWDKFLADKDGVKHFKKPAISPPAEPKPIDAKPVEPTPGTREYAPHLGRGI